MRGSALLGAEKGATPSRENWGGSRRANPAANAGFPPLRTGVRASVIHLPLFSAGTRLIPFGDLPARGSRRGGRQSSVPAPFGSGSAAARCPVSTGEALAAPARPRLPAAPHGAPGSAGSSYGSPRRRSALPAAGRAAISGSGLGLEPSGWWEERARGVGACCRPACCSAGLGPPGASRGAGAHRRGLCCKVVLKVVLRGVRKLKISNGTSYEVLCLVLPTAVFLVQYVFFPQNRVLLFLCHSSAYHNIVVFGFSRRLLGVSCVTGLQGIDAGCNCS